MKLQSHIQKKKIDCFSELNENGRQLHSHINLLINRMGQGAHVEDNIPS